jgi:hypothetical protein
MVYVYLLFACWFGAIARAGDFVGEIESPLMESRKAAMRGVVWREGCPVGLEDLAAVRVTHRGFDGQDHAGVIVVHKDAAPAVLEVFRKLYEVGFPIQEVSPIEKYGGDDARSMAANNTSGFNCRGVGGGKTWSQHAYGLAIDLNTVQNPYVKGERVSPPEGRGFLDRSAAVPGLIRAGDPVVLAFREMGWKWGGNWSSAKDYQHFSANGH